MSAIGTIMEGLDERIAELEAQLAKANGSVNIQNQVIENRVKRVDELQSELAASQANVLTLARAVNGLELQEIYNQDDSNSWICAFCEHKLAYDENRKPLEVEHAADCPVLLAERLLLAE